MQWDRKPATKLYNAWLAGVPAILSPDPAYQDLRRSEHDYLEAKTSDEIILQLKRLMDSPDLRHAMHANALSRAPYFDWKNNAERWLDLINLEIAPRYARWRRSRFRRKAFLAARHFASQNFPQLLR